MSLVPYFELMVLKTRQLGQKLRDPIPLPLPMPAFERYVLSVYVAKLGRACRIVIMQISFSARINADFHCITEYHLI